MHVSFLLIGASSAILNLFEALKPPLRAETGGDGPVNAATGRRMRDVSLNMDPEEATLGYTQVLSSRAVHPCTAPLHFQYFQPHPALLQPSTAVDPLVAETIAGRR